MTGLEPDGQPPVGCWHHNNPPPLHPTTASSSHPEPLTPSRRTAPACALSRLQAPHLPDHIKHRPQQVRQEPQAQVHTHCAGNTAGGRRSSTASSTVSHRTEKEGLERELLRGQLCASTSRSTSETACSSTALLLPGAGLPPGLHRGEKQHLLHNIPAVPGAAPGPRAICLLQFQQHCCQRGAEEQCSRGNLLLLLLPGWFGPVCPTAATATP